MQSPPTGYEERIHPKHVRGLLPDGCRSDGKKSAGTTTCRDRGGKLPGRRKGNHHR